MFTSKMQDLGHTKGFLFSNTLTWAADVTEDRDFGGQDNVTGDKVRMFAYSGHGSAPTDSKGKQTYQAPSFCDAGGAPDCRFDANNARLGESSGYYASPYPGASRYSM